MANTVNIVIELEYRSALKNSFKKYVVIFCHELNKAYTMFGRIGTSLRITEVPMYKAEKKLNEKISKDYQRVGTGTGRYSLSEIADKIVSYSMSNKAVEIANKLRRKNNLTDTEILEANTI